MEVSKYLPFVNAEKNWFFEKMLKIFLEVNYSKIIFVFILSLWT